MEEGGPGEQSVPPRGSHGAARQKQEQGDKRVSSGARLTKCQGATLPGAGPRVLPGKMEGQESPRGDGGQDLWSVLLLPPREKVARRELTRAAWEQTQ